MRNLLDGGEHLTLLKDEVMKKLEANPMFENEDVYDLNIDQERERTMKNIASFVMEFGDKLTNPSEEIRESTLEIFKLFDSSAATRRAVHVC
jgi:acyl-CoA oxidase